MDEDGVYGHEESMTLWLVGDKLDATNSNKFNVFLSASASSINV